MRIKSIYTKYSKFYKFFHTLQTLGADQKHRRLSVNQININSKKILEVSSGSGLCTELIIQKFPNIKIDCLDGSESMINLAKERLKNSMNINFIQMDIRKINEIQNKYDTIITTYGLGFLHHEELKIFLMNIKKLMHENSEFICCEMDENTDLKSNVYKLIHKKIVEPLIYWIWGFKDLKLKQTLKELNYNILYEKFLMDRILGSTIILRCKL